MSKTRIGQKAVRTGTLLIGMRDARVATLLEPYGYTAETLEEGWTLFMKVTGHRMDRVMSKPTRRSDIVTELGRFEDHWIPIVKAVLQRQHADAAEELFRNIERTEGNEAAFTLGIFFERLEAMGRGEAPYGKRGPEIRDYLRTRGLSDDVVAKAVKDLQSLKDIEKPEAPVEAVDEEAMQAAEEAMWQWYLEWSAIIRKVISDGNLLRSLGFKKRKTRTANGIEVEVVETAAPSEVVAFPAPAHLALPAE